jgi:uncharacterized ferredoxin-like protein
MIYLLLFVNFFLFFLARSCVKTMGSDLIEKLNVESKEIKKLEARVDDLANEIRRYKWNLDSL